MLRATRERLESDLDTFGERLQSSLNLRQQVVRHPALVIVAGAVVGYVLVKKPAAITRTIRRLAGWGAPLILSALLRPHPPSGNKESGSGR